MKAKASDWYKKILTLDIKKKRAELGFWKRSRDIQNSLRAVKAFIFLFTAEKINKPRAAVLPPFFYNSRSKTAQNKTDFAARFYSSIQNSPKNAKKLKNYVRKWHFF